MDVQTKKYQLIEWIISIQDIRLIIKLVKIAEETDLWENISDAEKPMLTEVLGIWRKADVQNIQKQESIMENISQVIWSEEAINNLKEIIDYLEWKWTERELMNFDNKLEWQVDIITKHPLSYSKSKKKILEEIKW